MVGLGVKKIFHVTNSRSFVSEFKKTEKKDILYWNEERSINQIVGLLEGDKAYNRQHAELLKDAYKWKEANRDTLLLSPTKISYQYQSWCDQAKTSGKEPQPNALMLDFVHSSISHAVARRRRRILAMSSVIFLIIVLAIASLSLKKAIDKKQEVVNQKN